MKRRLLIGSMVAGFAVPLGVSAQGGGMMAGVGSMMGGGSSTTQTRSMMQSDSMMGANRVLRSGTEGLPGARQPSEGEVRKVDLDLGKLTLQHGPLVNLDMPAMTMVFRVKDRAWLSGLGVGDRVLFVADRVDGKLTVTALAPAKR